MVSLTDIGRLRRKHKIDEDNEIDLAGISADALVVLIDRFPELRRMLVDQERALRELSAEKLLKLAPEVGYAVIAAGTGHLNDTKEEESARQLPFGVQLELLVKILSITFPKGISHLVETVQALGVAEFVGSAGTGWDQGTKLPSQSNGASPPDTDLPPGPTPQENLPAGSS